MVKLNFNRKYNIIQDKKCINPQCNNSIKIRIIGDKNSQDYTLPVPTDRKKIACSRFCHTIWQKTIPWEQRVGEEFAASFRETMSELSSTNNPSTFPGVAEKISRGLKAYLKNNPHARLGENNGFFGRRHSDATKQQWSDIKKGKWSYNQAQRKKQLLNTLKQENHPNWLGGISNGDYGLEFNRQYKLKIKIHYNFTCQICNEITNVLDIHHIDYDKKNNLFENLVPLCKSCHGRTNYNRLKWKNLLTKPL
jgi:hypothetical protein